MPEHLTLEDRWKKSWEHAVKAHPTLDGDKSAMDFHRLTFYSGAAHALEYIGKADPEQLNDLEAELNEFRSNLSHFIGGGGG